MSDWSKSAIIKIEKRDKSVFVYFVEAFLGANLWTNLLLFVQSSCVLTFIDLLL